MSLAAIASRLICLVGFPARRKEKMLSAEKRAHEELLRSMVKKHPDYRFGKCLRVGQRDMSCEIYLRRFPTFYQWRVWTPLHPKGSYQVITAEEALRAYEGYGIDL